MEWRRSAQRVTRAWNAWLAADHRDRGVRYRAFVAALADEERAATEVERMIELADAV
jgi:heme oxygenase